MKTKLFLSCLIMVIFATTSFSQNNDTLQHVSNFKEKKLSYSFINEYGLRFGAISNVRPLMILEVTGVFVNSICFNKKQDMIGIGVGCDAYWLLLGATFPIFVNYRHYFPSKTNIKPLINTALGTQINIDGNVVGIYNTVSGGFRYKALSLTAGIFLKSWDMIDYMGGAEIKIGYILFK